LSVCAVTQIILGDLLRTPEADRPITMERGASLQVVC
jgi:hypothetical protein